VAVKPASKSPGPGDNDRRLDAVEAFLECLDELSEGQLLELAAVWSKQDSQAHDDAWTRAVAVAARDGLTDRFEQARDAATHWATRGTNVPWPYGFNESARADIRRQAGPALADAAVALLLGERLDEETGEILIGPWRRTVDTPA
jgi:hypothetical protein